MTRKKHTETSYAQPKNQTKKNMQNKKTKRRRKKTPTNSYNKPATDPALDNITKPSYRIQKIKTMQIIDSFGLENTVLLNVLYL